MELAVVQKVLTKKKILVEPPEVLKLGILFHNQNIDAYQKKNT